MHDVVVNYRQKTIELKCQNGEILRIKSDDSSELPTVISSMLKCQRAMMHIFHMYWIKRCLNQGLNLYLLFVSFWMYF